MGNSTRRSSAAKPKKPRPDFPLFPHASGRWVKKVRGKFCYFGKVEGDPKGQAALALWLDQKDDLLAGRVPSAGRDGLTLHALCNAFCEAKERQANAGEITRRMFEDYRVCCQFALDAFGKRRLVDDLHANDFEKLRETLAKRFGPTALANRVSRIRSIFKYGFDASLIDRPVRLGPTFKAPKKRILRAARQAKGPMMFEAREIRRILKSASQPLKAMILLGINCGFGNGDCGTLPLTAVDLKAGWITYPRPKTAIERRCPLWPETRAVIEDAIALRPTPKIAEHKNLVFVTKYGDSWAKETADNPVGKEFTKLIKRLKLYSHGRGFYALRHGFETIGGESRDQVAVNAIMGHADASMASHYRERISDERLRAVTDSVRRWLFRRESADLWQSRRGREGGAK